MILYCDKPHRQSLLTAIYITKVIISLNLSKYNLILIPDGVKLLWSFILTKINSKCFILISHTQVHRLLCQAFDQVLLHISLLFYRSNSLFLNISFRVLLTAALLRETMKQKDGAENIPNSIFQFSLSRLFSKNLDSFCFFIPCFYI